MASVKPDYTFIDVLDFLPLAKAMAYTGCRTDATFFKKYGHIKVYSNCRDGREGIHLWRKLDLKKAIMKCEIKNK